MAGERHEKYPADGTEAEHGIMDQERANQMGEEQGEGDQGMDRSMETVELLQHGSLFLKSATQEDIEFEKEQLEAMHRCKLEPYRITHETRSGARVTRIEWRVVD